MNNKFKDKKITIVGLGKSGIASARLLSKEGATVSITENRKTPELEAVLEALLKEGVIRQRSDAELGVHTEAFINGKDLVVVSPGVRNDSAPILFAQKKNIPIISELELGYRFCPVPIVAVTGTSGKTTVTTLIGRVLQNSGKRAIVCGNIGNPLTGEIERLKDADFAIVETSSFQLEWIKTFRPRISIILNISDNHLDRHKDIQEYLNLKARIFENQRGADWVLLNGRDILVRGLKSRVNSKVSFFDEFEIPKDLKDLDWNEDFLAVASACSILGVKKDCIFDTLLNFNGLEHRLEFIKEIKGVGFFNDSKSTTISSMRWALNLLDDKIILIAGGRYKGGDFGSLGRLVRKKVNLVIAIGEARQKIKLALYKFCEVIEADTLKSAVELAYSRSKKGDRVLLSPGCSSFDMFRDFEERGRVFKEIVNNLKDEAEVQP